MDRLIEKYVEMRNDAQENVNSTYTSPRILLGVIRLCTALARINLCDEVTAEHVEEAIRLMDASKSSLNPRILDSKRYV
jgi:DNA replication licensing factor MCM7